MVTALASALPDFIQKRAAVHNIETGNWHLTIGNPMNPIMRIGNLACEGCTCSFNDELGPDDFPTEMTFDVKLKPMMPRDGKAIRRMFNIGKDDYIDKVLGNTSDQVNTYGNQYKTLYSASIGSAAPSKNVGNKTGQTATGGNARIIPKNTLEHVTEWIKNMYGDGTKKILTPGTEERLKRLYFSSLDPNGSSTSATNTQTMKTGN
jgi:hypothetical protein